MSPVVIPNLEMHVTHACNLKCSNCTHFSDFGFTGHLSINSADRQMGYWSSRLQPRYFSLLGGEPALHPELPEFVELAARHWPRSTLQLVTNGFFLGRHADKLPQILEKYQIRLEISVHHKSPDYEVKLAPVKLLVQEWQAAFQIPVRWRESFGRWTRIYRETSEGPLPYDDRDPAASWSHCTSRWCPQLAGGRLYKCPQAAYLPMLDQKIGLSKAWNPYLRYQPLEPGCSDEVLREFVNREVESVCGMCPAHPEKFSLPLPLPQASSLSKTR